MKIILTGLDGSLVFAWRQYFAGVDFVTVQHGSILDLECDAIVSPANSYGFMDGGIDLLYRQHFGWKVQERLQRLIVEKHHGELLVGAAEIVETDNPKIPYIIAAPTMRTPMVLDAKTLNPYLAARAVLLLVKHGRFSSGSREGEPISEIVNSCAFPGLGTGVGEVSPEVCARQMRVAIDEVLLNRYKFPSSWLDVKRMLERL